MLYTDFGKTHEVHIEMTTVWESSSDQLFHLF